MKDSSLEKSKNLIEVGKIIKPFGIKGEVIVTDYADDFETFINFKNFYIKIKENGISTLKKFEIIKFRGNKNKIILSLENFENINDAEKLRNCKVYVLREDIILKEGEYLFDDLIGCECFYQDLKIGIIVGMPNYGTCDMFEIEYYEPKPLDKKNNETKFINIPYFKELIEKIDIDKKIVYFNESYKDYI
jgi:16S rRNA processing protein RimM